MKSTMFGSSEFAREYHSQRQWWRSLDRLARRLEEVAEQGPSGANLAKATAQSLLRQYENASTALSLLGGWLGHPQVLEQLVMELELDDQPWRQITTIESLWQMVDARAEDLVRDRRKLARDDYPPSVRATRRGEDSAISLLLRRIARYPDAQTELAQLGWDLPPATASRWELEDFFTDLCEAAAGPGLSARTSA